MQNLAVYKEWQAGGDWDCKKSSEKKPYISLQFIKQETSSTLLQNTLDG